VKDVLPSNIFIVTGLYNFTSSTLASGNGIQASKIIIHASYAPNGLTNDIAVIRLTTEVVIDLINTALICIPPENTPNCADGTPVVASGWGSTTGDPNRPSSSRPVQLQQVSLKCIPNTQKDCKPLTHLLGFLNQNSKMCAYAEWKGVCFGDSGGPLVRERKLGDGTVYLEQAGIMSGTIDCSFTQPKPDVYANVPVFGKWIRDQCRAMP